MPVSAQHYINVLKEAVSRKEERVAGYGRALWEHLGNIVYAESSNTHTPDPIQQKVTDQTKALGKYLHDNKKNAGVEP